jgi:hypothetical protein
MRVRGWSRSLPQCSVLMADPLPSVLLCVVCCVLSVVCVQIRKYVRAMQREKAIRNEVKMEMNEMMGPVKLPTGQEDDDVTMNSAGSGSGGSGGETGGGSGGGSGGMRPGGSGSGEKSRNGSGHRRNGSHVTAPLLAARCSPPLLACPLCLPCALPPCSPESTSSDISFPATRACVCAVGCPCAGGRHRQRWH